MTDVLTLGRLMRAYLRMLPALVIAWAVAAGPPGPGVREAFILALLSVFVIASAAAAEGLHPGRGAVRIALDRFMAHSVNILLLLLYIALAAGVGGTLGGMLAGAAGLPVEVVGTLTALLAALPILAWYWPMAALAVAAPEWIGHRSEASPWLWRGPGHTSARRLSRRFGDPARTIPVLLLAYVWLGLLVAADAYDGESSLPLAIELASYFVFLPVLGWLTVLETRALIDRALARIGEAASSSDRPPLS